jgi:hypothetical protein
VVALGYGLYPTGTYDGRMGGEDRKEKSEEERQRGNCTKVLESGWVWGKRGLGWGTMSCMFDVC